MNRRGESLPQYLQNKMFLRCLGEYGQKQNVWKMTELKSVTHVRMW